MMTWKRGGSGKRGRGGGNRHGLHTYPSSTNTMEEGGREGGENYTHNNAHNIALGKSRPSGQVGERERERSSYYSSLPYIFLFSLPVFGIRLKVTGCFKKAGSAQSST